MAQPPAAASGLDAATLSVIDRFLPAVAEDRAADIEDAEALIGAALLEHLPAADPGELDLLKPIVRRRLLAAVRTAGLLGETPGLPLTQVLDEGRVLRPMRVFSGVIAAVVLLPGRDTLPSLGHWVLPFGEQMALEALIRDCFGLTRDAVSVCTFPFLPEEYRQSGLAGILAGNMAAGALQQADTDFSVPYRQCLLRRSLPRAAWELPDGRLGVPLVLPVTVISLVSSEYWEADQPDDRATADRMGSILAAGLAARELSGCAVEVFGGQLHVGSDSVAWAAEAMAEDLAGRGGRYRLFPQRTGGKVGRNLACPCGSGLKYKKCCAS